MEVSYTDRGFGIILFNEYPDRSNVTRLVQESSLIGDYEDSYDNPGSSFLWIGDNHYLNRDDVRELISHLQKWVDTGKLGGVD